MQRRGLVRQALEYVNEDGVGFGHVETNVRDRIGDELFENRQDGGGEDWKREGRCESLRPAVSIISRERSYL